MKNIALEYVTYVYDYYLKTKCNHYSGWGKHCTAKKHLYDMNKHKSDVDFLEERLS